MKDRNIQHSDNWATPKELYDKLNAEFNFEYDPCPKELACWIYYEDGSNFYCFDCVEKRIDEINKNREFADDIDYEGGDTCGYFQDYADTEGSHEAKCCQCHKPLFTLGVD